MANVTKRTNKAGEISYLIRVFVYEGTDGKQTTKSMTWKPPKGMRPTAADKQAEKEAVLFEEKVRSGIVTIDGKIKFADYAAQWEEAAEFKPKTKYLHQFLLHRINQGIGHIPLEKLRVEHIQMFIKNIRESGVRKSDALAVSTKLESIVKASGITKKRLSEIAGIQESTTIAACRGKRVRVKTADLLSAALGYKTEELFEFLGGDGALSSDTVRKHYNLIRSILKSAKRAHIVPHNVAEFMEPPKSASKEARYYDDEEAKAFLAALMKEPDIRIKTAFTVSLFTGVRLGELCGLAWPDIDFADNMIYVRRASQYVFGHGVIEVPTKNKSSERSITVTPFIMTLLKDYRKWWIERRLMCGDAWQGEKERLLINDNGKPLSPTTVHWWLSRFTRQNNLPYISPHGLRHTFITLQITAGVDIRTLQARTGHAEATTLLNVYSHAVQSAQEKAAQAMDDVLLPSVKN